MARAYAAPALVVLMAATAAGAIAWSVNAADRARPSLAKLGVELLSTPDGLEAIAGSRFKSQSLPEADRLLAKLPVLRVLDHSRTEVASVEPFKGLTALQSLDLVGTNVMDLRPLEGLTALRSLELSNTQIADIAPLKGLSALQSLNLFGTEVANVEPLKGLAANLNNTQVADLTPLQDLPNLIKVNGVADEELKKLNAYRGSINLPLVK
jgi:Leucine-rich repeat (LRR) protein